MVHFCVIKRLWSFQNITNRISSVSVDFKRTGVAVSQQLHKMRNTFKSSEDNIHLESAKKSIWTLDNKTTASISNTLPVKLQSLSLLTFYIYWHKNVLKWIHEHLAEDFLGFIFWV